MKLLFDGKLTPITSEIGFLEADTVKAAKAFVDWQSLVQQKRGVSVKQREVSGNLEEVLQTLLPLTSVERRRFLFVPTATPWVAYFDNGYQGGDPLSIISYLAKQVQARGLRTVAIPNTIEGEFKTARGQYGANIFELYGPQDTDFLNYIRSITLANDGGKWVFAQSGTPLPFEDTSLYKARDVKQRFNFDTLQQYLKNLNLFPFEEDFYLPASNNKAILIEKSGPVNPNLKEYSLAEARYTLV